MFSHKSTRVLPPLVLVSTLTEERLHNHAVLLQGGDTPIDAVVRAATGVKKS